MKFIFLMLPFNLPHWTMSGAIDIWKCSTLNKGWFLVAGSGIEPLTSGLWVLRSNRLSYPATYFHNQKYFDSTLFFLKLKYTYSRFSSTSIGALMELEWVRPQKLKYHSQGLYAQFQSCWTHQPIINRGTTLITTAE